MDPLDISDVECKATLQAWLCGKSVNLFVLYWSTSSSETPQICDIQAHVRPKLAFIPWDTVRKRKGLSSKETRPWYEYSKSPTYE